MARLLHIMAHPAPTHSQTLRIAEAFLEGYRTAHPDDEIVTINLCAESPSFITVTHLAALRKQGQPETMTDEETRAWQEITSTIAPLFASQKFLLATPMWNFSVPAVLKAYIDLIVQAGLTFKYTEIGVPVGMLTDRKMVIINTRGGVYSQAPMQHMEMCVRYLHNVFSFLGVSIAHEIVAEGMAVVGADGQEEIIAQAIAQARDVGLQF